MKMFHTYVLTACDHPYEWGRKSVDFDRASFLMDKELLQQSSDALRRTGLTLNQSDAAQWVWDHYCERHRERYVKPFRPDVDPWWDVPPRPPPPKVVDIDWYRPFKPITPGDPRVEALLLRLKARE